MPTCELTGKECPYLVEVIIEGVQMKVAPEQAKYGKPIEKEINNSIKTRKPFYPQQSQKTQIYEFILPNAGTVVKQAREKLGLRQIDLAKKLLIKESTIHQVESGHLKPTVDEAKKLEEGLGIIITAKKTLKNDVELEHTKTSSFTIGDMIKDKRTK